MNDESATALWPAVLVVRIRGTDYRDPGVLPFAVVDPPGCTEGTRVLAARAGCG